MAVVMRCLLLLAWAVAAHGATPEPRVVRLADRVFALLGLEEMPDRHNRGLIGNSTLVVGTNGAILIDSGFTHEIGLALRQAAGRIAGKPVTHVINTHAHGDHFLGNTAFPEAEIISSEACREGVEREGSGAVALIRSLTGEATPATRPVPATRILAEGSRTRLELEGVKLDIWVPAGGAHTRGDLLVSLPDDQVLVAGDVLASGAVPNFRDANAHAWLAALAGLEKLPFALAVPGHGEPMTRAQVADFAGRLRALYAGIEAGFKRGLSDSDVRQTLDLRDWQALRRFDELGMLINRIYVEVEARDF